MWATLSKVAKGLRWVALGLSRLSGLVGSHGLFSSARDATPRGPHPLGPPPSVTVPYNSTHLERGREDSRVYFSDLGPSTYILRLCLLSRAYMGFYFFFGLDQSYRY